MHHQSLIHFRGIKIGSFNPKGKMVIFHLEKSTKKSTQANFMSKWSSWLEFSQNIIYQVIWSRIDQKRIETCKISNLRLRNFSKCFVKKCASTLLWPIISFNPSNINLWFQAWWKAYVTYFKSFNYIKHQIIMDQGV